MRYFINLSYDGAAYHGWQVQPDDVTVQQRLNEALATLLRIPVETVGAGRTDAGVNAACMVAHFDCDALPYPPEQLAYKLNRILPPDIAIHGIRPVKDDAHARFSALARTYHYYIYTEKSPFRRRYAMRLPFAVDYEKMNRAAEILLQTEDFTSFSKLHTDTKTNICHVTAARWGDGARPLALHHHGRPLPAQHGAGRGGHAPRCRPRQNHGRRPPPHHQCPRPLFRRRQRDGRGPFPRRCALSR